MLNKILTLISCLVLISGIFKLNGFVILLGISGLIMNLFIRLSTFQEIPTRNYIPQSIKKEVFIRQRGMCGYPGCNCNEHLKLHHIVPLHLGGTDHSSNLVYLCGTHHDYADNLSKVYFKNLSKGGVIYG